MTLYEVLHDPVERLHDCFSPGEIHCVNKSCIFQNKDELCTYPEIEHDDISVPVVKCNHFVSVKAALCWILADIILRIRNGET